jgi:hypothetical protein
MTEHKYTTLNSLKQSYQSVQAPPGFTTRVVLNARKPQQKSFPWLKTAGAFALVLLAVVILVPEQELSPVPHPELVADLSAMSEVNSWLEAQNGMSVPEMPDMTLPEFPSWPDSTEESPEFETQPQPQQKSTTKPRLYSLNLNRFNQGALI